MNIDPTEEIASDLTSWQPSGLTQTVTGSTGVWKVIGQWIKISWEMPVNAPTPEYFEVCAYLASTGTPQSGPYLINPTKVENTKRSYQKSVNALGLLPVSITSITKAASAVITTSSSHGFAINDQVYFTNILGMTQLSDNYGSPTAYATISAVTSTTFTINVNTTSYGTYTANTGIVTPVQKYKAAVRAIYS